MSARRGQGSSPTPNTVTIRAGIKLGIFVLVSIL